VQVTRNGGLGPTTSPDGHFVYYAKGLELWRVRAGGGDEVRVLESAFDWSRYAVNADGIFFMPARPPMVKSIEHTIEFFSLADSRTRIVARLAKPPYLGLTVSPDARRLLYTQIDQAGTDLMLVEDFR
jgi:hypothetical protein